MTEQEISANGKVLCRLDLKFLCKNILRMDDWDTCHDDLLEWDTKNKEKRFKLYLLPRGHLKTSILTIGKTIQEVLKNFDTTILLTSAVWNNSRTFLSEIKEYLTSKSSLRYLFKKFDSDLWNSDQITVSQRMKANKTPTIDTAGIEKTMTSQHYKIIKADDLVNRENITSKDQILKTLNYFKDLIKLLEPDGKLEVIGTRWHDSDLYGHIIKELSKNIDEPFVVYKKKDIEDEKVIFPKKFSFEKLADIKRQIGSFDYSANYKNEPIDTESQHFKPPVKFWQEFPEGYPHLITVDLAISEKTQSDYTVIMNSVRTNNGQIFCLNYFRGHYNVSETINKIFTAVQLAKNNCVVAIESVGYQKALIQIMDQEKVIRGLSNLKIIPISQSRDKFMRIISLQSFWENGNLLLKQGMEELIDELFRFPVSEHDDLADALAMVLQIDNAESRTVKNKNCGWIPPKYRIENRVKEDVFAWR